MSMRTQVKLRMDGSATFASKNIYFQIYWAQHLEQFFARFRAAGLSDCHSFLKGSISMRRTHIARYVLVTNLFFVFCQLTTNDRNPKCHFPIYECRCREQGILMHERAIPAGAQASLARYAYNLYTSMTCAFLPISIPDSRLLMGLSCHVHLSSQRQA